MRRFMIVAALTMFFALGTTPATISGEEGWQSIDDILDTAGKDLPGDVHRYGWPRTDLHVRLGEVSVEPPLALGSWAAFKRTGTGQGAMAVGDLVLLGPEVNPVARELEARGFEVLAIHNHLIEETPRVLYLHFQGTGDAASLAQTLKMALAKTKTPVGSASGTARAKPTADQEKVFTEIQSVLGRKGAMAGSVLQVGVPRAQPIMENGMEVLPGMGMATAINFQTVDNRVATTGDFVLIADEVNPVIRELYAHGIEVTALHSHMLRETPRLFFIHFWRVGSAKDIATGLKAALARVAVVPTGAE